MIRRDGLGASAILRGAGRLFNSCDPSKALTVPWPWHSPGSEPAWAAARASLISYVQGFHAADPARLSIRWLLERRRTMR
jgi:hypothetical protein